MELEEGLSAVRFEGDYGFDEFLSNGGASSDKEVAGFLAEKLPGNPDLEFAGKIFGCSTVTAENGDGEVLFGRNFDWNSCDAMAVMSYPENGYSSISTVNMDFIRQGAGGMAGLLLKADEVKTLAALYAPLDGMNEKGLAVSVNMIQDPASIDQNTEKPDITTTTAVRLLLDKAGTVEEALELLDQYDMHASMGMMVHLAVADASGNSVAVEYIDNKIIVLTEFVAADLHVGIGDTVSASAGSGSERYRVSGIYQCANDMGANVGLSREGYRKIGKETAGMWCVHFFLEDVDMQPRIMEALHAAYGGDVYLHENSWPGLYGILSAMKLLMYFMYGIELIMIFVITALTGSRLLVMEQKDMGIYRSFGFTAGRLRLSFAMRFGMVSLLGALSGMLCSTFLTDRLVAPLLRMFGISNFSSHPTLGNVLFPALLVILSFTVSAWLAAGKIKTDRLTALLAN